MEGACGSVGDCWKGLRVGRTLKHFWNWEVVGVQRMPKVSEVGVGKLQDRFRAEKRSSPDTMEDGDEEAECDAPKAEEVSDFVTCSK